MLYSGEVRNNWLNVIKNAPKSQQTLNFLPLYERALSQARPTPPLPFSTRGKKLLFLIISGEKQHFTSWLLLDGPICKSTVLSRLFVARYSVFVIHIENLEVSEMYLYSRWSCLKSGCSHEILYICICYLKLAH